MGRSRFPACHRPDSPPLRITRPVPSRSLSLAMREWARANGYPVSDRGRVADRIVEAFLAANPDAYEQAGKIELVRATARGPGPSPEGFAWQRNSRLGPIYTVVFAQGIDEYEILRQLGVAAEDIRTILDEDHSQPEGPQIITVTQVGNWAVAVEEDGWRGADSRRLADLSDGGGEAVAVMRHDYAARHYLAYAVDGVLVLAPSSGPALDVLPADVNAHLAATWSSG
nr:histone-like nucleoid-structuring protein Lsr2 [Streptosporangium roseum]